MRLLHTKQQLNEKTFEPELVLTIAVRIDHMDTMDAVENGNPDAVQKIGQQFVDIINIIINNDIRKHVKA